MAEQRGLRTLLTLALEDFLEDEMEEEELHSHNRHNRQEEAAVVAASLFNVNPRISIHGYAEKVVPMYRPSEFQSHFRLTSSTFEVLCQIVGNYPEMHLLYGHGGREVIDVSKQLMVALWTLGNKEAYRSIADRFNITKSSVSRVLVRVAECLTNHGRQYIYWPNGEQTEIIESFEMKCKIPGVLGAIDGCHIPIKAPTTFPETYINRKKFHSVILQGVCDQTMLFRDVFAGWPGSVHDARVFRNSPLYLEAERREEELFPGDKHLLGDSAYPLEKWLLTPYRDNGHLTREQNSFNFAQSSGRQVIERCFALLKGRFRRLKYLDINVTNTIPTIITACCILHNICLSAGDVINIETDDQDMNVPVVNYIGQNMQNGADKRERISRMLA